VEDYRFGQDFPKGKNKFDRCFFPQENMRKNSGGRGGIGIRDHLKQQIT